MKGTKNMIKQELELMKFIDSVLNDLISQVERKPYGYPNYRFCILDLYQNLSDDFTLKYKNKKVTFNEFINKRYRNGYIIQEYKFTARNLFTKIYNSESLNSNADGFWVSSSTIAEGTIC